MSRWIDKNLADRLYMVNQVSDRKNSCLDESCFF